MQSIEAEKIVRKYFEEVIDEIVSNKPVAAMLAHQVTEKRKNKIMINGLGGRWANINIQLKQGAENWRHISISHK